MSVPSWDRPAPDEPGAPDPAAETDSAAAASGEFAATPDNRSAATPEGQPFATPDNQPAATPEGQPLATHEGQHFATFGTAPDGHSVPTFEMPYDAGPTQSAWPTPAAPRQPFDRPLYQPELEPDDEFVSYAPPWDAPPDDDIWGSAELDEAAASQPAPENGFGVLDLDPTWRRPEPPAGAVPDGQPEAMATAVQPEPEADPHAAPAAEFAPALVDLLESVEVAPPPADASGAAEPELPRLVFPDVDLPPLAEPATEADPDDALAPIAPDLLLSTPSTNGQHPWPERDPEALLLESVPESQPADQLEFLSPETSHPEEAAAFADSAPAFEDAFQVAAETAPPPGEEEPLLNAEPSTEAPVSSPDVPGVLGWSPGLRYSSVFGDLFRTEPGAADEHVHEPAIEPATERLVADEEFSADESNASRDHEAQDPEAPVEPADGIEHAEPPDPVEWPPIPVNLFSALPQLNLAPDPAPEVAIQWPEDPRAQIFWPPEEQALPAEQAPPDEQAPHGSQLAAEVQLAAEPSTAFAAPAQPATPDLVGERPAPEIVVADVPPSPERGRELPEPADGWEREHDPVYTPRDPRFEPRFLLEDVPANRPLLIFSDPVPHSAPVVEAASQPTPEPVGTGESPFARLANQASAFAERIPDRWAIGSGPGLTAVGEDAVARELGDVQSPTLTVLFAVVAIAAVVLFVYLVTPLLR